MPGNRRRSSLAPLVGLLLFGLASTASAQEDMTLQVFGDVNGTVSSVEAEKSAFSLGGLDLFYSSSLGDNFEMLAETVLEILDDGPVFDLERLYVQYNFAPAIEVRGGRFHLPLGYYQTAYHHATLFQLATQRPVQWRFEDDGGPLPSHVVGLDALGVVPLGAVLSLSYDVFVGNGRGHFGDEITNTADANRNKMVGGRVGLVVADLEVGIGASLDRIPGGLTDAAGDVLVPEDLSELITEVHAAYMGYPFEVIGEAFYLRHKGYDSEDTYDFVSAYGQAGYEIDRFTPYGRLDWLKRDVDDPFFNASGTPLEVLELVVGVRQRLHEKAVLKAELSREFEDEINRAAVQAAFSF